MTRSHAKELLDAATSLPWSQPHAPSKEAATLRHIIREHGDGPQIANTILGEDAALIVYAVNTLPAYEAAVQALRGLVDEWTDGTSGLYGPEFPVRFDEAREALRRLQEQTQ